MTDKIATPAYARIVGAIFLCTLAIIMIAGLWPFQAPKNQVEWLEKENGLELGHHGSVLSSSPFHAHDSGDDSSGSLEIWLEPAQSRGRNTILILEEDGGTDAPFLLQQYGSKLVVQRRNIDDRGTPRIAEFAIERALSENRRVFITITLGQSETAVYLDGAPVRASEISGRTLGEFNGRIVLGNSLTASDSWSGKILGLAVYKRQLTPAQVSGHYQDWMKNHRPVLTEDDQPVALYLFTERAGNVVHNQLSSATDLNIPVRYFVLHSAFLSLPWYHYHPTWSYWGDVGINVVGFIPFGFFLVAYLSTTRAARNAAAITIFLGFLTSLMIEVLQAYLPTRDSGMNDLITNTLGTGLGAVLYHSVLIRSLMSKVSFNRTGFPREAQGNIQIGSPV